jgi:multisubunit Na+/H+ antiporter MnhB subunit
VVTSGSRVFEKIMRTRLTAIWASGKMLCMAAIGWVRRTVNGSLDKCRAFWSAMVNLLVRTKQRTLRFHQRLRARMFNRIYRTRYQLSKLLARFGDILVIGILLLLISVTVYTLPHTSSFIQPYFEDAERFSALRALLQAVGGALIGAAAIVSSLVLFAMQTNVERMPYGLFRRFGSDMKLLSAFGATFVLALVVASLSTLPDKSWSSVAIIAASWAVTLLLILFLYAYRRALNLINPTRQLELVARDAVRELQTWARRSTRAAPLFDDAQGAQQPGGAFGATHDLGRMMYFRINSHWTDGPTRALQYVISIARRYAERGDHEVSESALSALVAINAGYVKAKGKTFFTTTPFIDNPLVTDAFINDTLEHLRQYTRAGIGRRDEEQIEQAFRALASLVGTYLSIDYSQPHSRRPTLG